MKIFVHGSKDKQFFKTDEIREIYYADCAHDGNNIDELRPWYCELTGLYYGLENFNDEILGLEQYGRFLLGSDKVKPIGKNEILAILSSHDAICGNNKYPEGSQIKSWPQQHGLWPYFDICLNVIGDIYDKDMQAHFTAFLNGDWHCHGNLIIASRNLLKDYFDFITRIFDEIKSRIDIRQYPRMIEYLSEFLMGAWLTYKKKKICFVPWNCKGRVIIDGPAYDRLHNKG